MVEWRIERYDFRVGKTFGRLLIDGKQVCDVLEDCDRSLRQDMPTDEIAKRKVPGFTAIPHGRYRVDFAYSPRFERDMMTIHDVPGFVGVRIHAGNTERDTEGCPLLGVRNGEILKNSRKTVEHVEDMLRQAGGKAILTIVADFDF